MEPETVAISKFKATCLELLRKVKKTGQPLIVTKNGEPIALISSPPQPEVPESWLGSFRESGSIQDDLLDPASDPEDWEALGS